MEKKKITLEIEQLEERIAPAPIVPRLVADEACGRFGVLPGGRFEGGPPPMLPDIVCPSGTDDPNDTVGDPRP